MVLQLSEPAVRTDELASFLCKVNEKRASYLHRPYRSLRIEAVLEATLKKAQSELESRQRMRKRKWLSLKQEWLAKNVLEASKRPRHCADQYDWHPNQNGEWGMEVQQTDDPFNLKDFFRDLDSVYNERCSMS